ncbi:MAG: PIG-L family deacetylase [Ferruginibacter sp.]
MKAKTIILLLSASFFLSFNLRNSKNDKKIIMAIFAHADDEIPVAPLLSKYAKDGYTVYWVIASKGEKGIRQHAGIPEGDSLAAVRMNEAICVSKALGIVSPIFLGMNDGTLDEDFTGEPLHKKIDSVLKQYKPNIIITWGPDGGYGHVDHRMIHNVVSEIFQSGLLSQLQELYYSGVPTEHWQNIPSYKTDIVKFFHQGWRPVKKEYLTTRIKCDSKYIENARQAVYCYNSQFTKEEMEDLKLWMQNMNKDTVYLRPFTAPRKITYKLTE